jgi:hypothetical protein
VNGDVAKPALCASKLMDDLSGTYVGMEEKR